jgi:polar amino acid transport system permease protein/polar amino acid transport system substrate-binding protein
MVKIITEFGGLLLFAMGHTLLLALCGLFFGCILGVIFGLLSVLKNKFCRALSTAFIYAIRGVPMIVLAFFVFFGVPYFFNSILHTSHRVVLTALQAGTICLALNCGAYMAEIIRAGIQSVDVGQMEASRSLGLTYWRSMFKIVLPQAIKTMIPSIINQFIITLKDTSILSVIGFPELVNNAKNVVSVTMMSFQTWAIVGVMYLIIITLLSVLAKRLEGRLSYHERQGDKQ